MDELYKNIKHRREALNMSQDELAVAVGYTSRTSIAKVESGKIDIPQSKIEAFAKALHCTPSELMGWGELQPVDVPLWKKRVVGKIAAGYGHEPIYEYTGEEVYVPSIPGYKEDDVLVLEVYGTSMYPKFLPKDKVVIKYCSSVDSGDIAAVMVDGETSLKKVVYHKEGETEQFMELIPFNPEYETKYISGPQLNDCKVIGKVIKLMRDV